MRRRAHYRASARANRVNPDAARPYFRRGRLRESVYEGNEMKTGAVHRSCRWKLLDKALDRRALFGQFLVCICNPAARELTDREPSHDLIFAVLTGDRIAEEHAFGDVVA